MATTMFFYFYIYLYFVVIFLRISSVFLLLVVAARMHNFLCVCRRASVALFRDQSSIFTPTEAAAAATLACLLFFIPWRQQTSKRTKPQ